ncbi:MAG: response regulator [Candidatus Omnitrophica bacterium]|nr:response regulator [Candidatus Omnitrophota bacterium]
MKNKKIAIIDEDIKIVRNLEGIISAIGHDPVVVNDSLLAVETVVQKRPDVILMELSMPRKNGFELADEMNHALDTAKIPIIAMSRFFKVEFRFLLNLCGIHRYLRKPFFPLEVIWAIENVIEENDLMDNGRVLEPIGYVNYNIGKRY